MLNESILFSSRQFSYDVTYDFFYIRIKSETHQAWYDSGIGLLLIPSMIFYDRLSSYVAIYIYIYTHDSAGVPLSPRVPLAPLPPPLTLLISMNSLHIRPLTVISGFSTWEDVETQCTKALAIPAH